MYVDAIVQELFTRLRAPLIVLDADMELVAHSIHQDVEHDAAQVAMIVSRRGTTGASKAWSDTASNTPPNPYGYREKTEGRDTSS
jgi:hypothetical protein